jgi:hypothetical protein
VIELEDAQGREVRFEGGKVGIALRSPSDMIHFLGQIVAADMRSVNRRCGAEVPRVTAPDGREQPIFCLIRGGSGRRAVASARFEGETYVVPRSDFGGGVGYPSFQALALVKDVINVYKTRQDIPSSTVIAIQ